MPSERPLTSDELGLQGQPFDQRLALVQGGLTLAQAHYLAGEAPAADFRPRPSLLG